MKLKVNYRTACFTPSLRVSMAEPRDACLERLRRAVEGEFVQVRGTHGHWVTLALNEAEALALQTGVPHLVFPELAREKARAVAAWHRRQQKLQRPAPSLAFAA
jgi:hypothetical protein